MVAEETNAEEKSSESKAMPLNLQTENKILSRKEKRKQLKKLKRKALRKEAANKEKALEEALLNDPEEQRRLQIEEQAETEASEKARQEFEERERIWLENYQRALEEEASRRKQEEEEKLSRCQEESLANTEADWECTEEQPAEVIWQGNEIIVKKKRVKVPKQKVDESNSEEREQPISNPLPPQPAFSDGYKCLQVTSGCNVFDDIEKQMPNFGTEQDAAHCPFYIKTGACRFGSHCSRAHFYPDKSCTLLMRNMYNGPGLSWEQDEGLEVCGVCC